MLLAQSADISRRVFAVVAGKEGLVPVANLFVGVGAITRLTIGDARRAMETEVLPVFTNLDFVLTSQPNKTWNIGTDMCTDESTNLELTKKRNTKHNLPSGQTQCSKNSSL